MRQVAKRLGDGRLELTEVPDPGGEPGSVKVRVEASLLSAGTERATLDVARKNLIAKAKARPEQARQVIDRARKEGVRSTVELVRQRLAELSPLGYSAAGIAVEVGERVRGITAGQRVAIGGGGEANHAEIDVVPQLLCAPVPDGVSAEEGAFATVGAIAMHGFRRGEVGVGGTVAVIGLGLVGQLTTQIALAAGTRVLGIDLQQDLLDRAASAGAETSLRSELGDRWNGTADAVLICASAPDSDDPIRLAAQLARDRAPIVVVGDVQLDLPRPLFFDGEHDLRLSRSYGPGRYDASYELHGVDYPIGYVRWTEQRNMEAFLWLVAEGKVRPRELISHRFGFGDAEKAFAVLTGDEPSDDRVVGIVLEYGDQGRAGADEGSSGATVGAAGRGGASVRTPPEPSSAPAWVGSGNGRFGLLGAGKFASGVLIPGLTRAGLKPAVIASNSGLSAKDLQGRFDFEEAVEGEAEIIGRDDVDLVVIATQHDSHGRLAAAALEAGQAVYVEKPLALNEEELAEVAAAQRKTGAPLFVGFNRRYAPLALELKKLSGPKVMDFRVNAGPLPVNHWTNDPERGGGRLLGEGCHFVDFLCDHAGSDPVLVSARGFPSDSALPLVSTDNFSLQISFADGSVGTVAYTADAPTGPGKERFSTSSPGAYGEIEDFAKGSIWHGAARTRLGGRSQDKGFAAQYELLARVMRGEAEAPDADSFLLSSLATLAAVRSLRSGRPEPVVAVDG